MRTLEEIINEHQPEILQQIEDIKVKNGETTEEIIIKTPILSDSITLEVLSEFYEIPKLESISESEIDFELVKKLPISFTKKYRLMPLSKQNGCLKIAFAPPLDLYALDEVKSLFDCSLETYITHSHVIVNTINRIYEQGKEVSGEIEGETGISETELPEPKDLIEADDEAPIIRFVNSLLFQATKEKASDIHIECFEKEVAVRYRKDGILHNVTSIPKKLQSSVISRVKIMAELDIAEKRKPQDGRIRLKVAGRDVDVRISTVPTTWGESVVMRLLDRASVVLSFEELGLGGQKLKTLESLIKRPHGIVLVTGPTGSGKTTSLYAALQRINSPDKKIITIEDPVEYQIQGINQIQVNNKVNLSFANGLRSVLRQDPDVILVGEIRDRETADISIHASLTGHLVFSTLHTNDSASAITRLIDMDIEPFLVASSLLSIIAQRLVRILCNHCKEKYVPADEELRRIGIKRIDIPGETLYKPKGCPRCVDTGFSGRIAIFEILLMDDEIRHLTLTTADSSTVKKKAVERGLVTLRMDGADKVLRGITSIEEVLRVTEEESVEIVVQ
ncbi:MAG: type II secretion system ATPase GspE [Thermodesulfobacteriota bacterium]